MEIKPHRSTMTPYQRKELIRILSGDVSINDLALLTDPELHERWLVLCEYDNIYKATKTSKQ